MTQFHYIKGIDGLRALAVLAVILFHLEPALLPGGFSGVDVFFVISGYVVSASLYRYANTGLINFTTGFYARRILRLFPALLTCLVIVSLVSTLIAGDSWPINASNKNGLYAFFGLGNLSLIWSGDGYFSPRTELNFFAHTWSLGVEEQFYLVFPVAFYIWVQNQHKKGPIKLLGNGVLVGLFTLSLLYSIFETSQHPDNAFYLLPSRFWELASGAWLFQLHTQGKLSAQSKQTNSVILSLGFLLIGFGFVYSNNAAFPFPWALLSVTGTVLLITGLLFSEDQPHFVQRLLESNVLRQIGKTSYSLYLWHWPIYVLFRWTVGLETYLEIGSAVALTFIFANASYFYIETPIRNARLTKTKSNFNIIGVGILSVLIAFSISVSIFKSQPTISLSTTTDNSLWRPIKWSKHPTEKTTANHQLFVLGDSHAKAYTTLLHNLSDNHDVQVVMLNAPGCGVANLLEPQKASCYQKIESYLSLITKLASPGDTVFLASLRMEKLIDQWGNTPNSSPSLKQKAALQEAQDLLKRLTLLKVHVVIDAPKPVFKAHPFRCSDWFNKNNPICTPGFLLKRSILLKRRQSVMTSIQILKKDFPQLIVWDPFPILCPNEVCSAFREGKPLFFDADHLSAYGNMTLYPSFAHMMKKVWAADP